MCLMCKPGMRLRERPCMRKYSVGEIERLEELIKQEEFERRLKKARKRGKV